MLSVIWAKELGMMYVMDTTKALFSFPLFLNFEAKDYCYPSPSNILLDNLKIHNLGGELSRELYIVVERSWHGGEACEFV